MAFSTWTALYSEMLDDLQSGGWRTKSYRIGDRSREFTDGDDFRAWLSFVEQKKNEEAAPSVGRTYAKQGGRGA